MSTSESKTVVLKSCDNEIFQVEEAVAVESQTIKHLFEDDCADNVIPLPNVNSEVLSKVIAYCRCHVAADLAADEAAIEDLKTFDKEFVKVNRPMLFELILAANYLNIKKLLDLVCDTAADMIKDCRVEEMRQIFGITNDFTPEEEAMARAENAAWAYE